MLYQSNYSIEAIVANQSVTMETDTISKNGRSMKSLMCRGNTFTFVLVLFVVVSLGMGLSACSESNVQSGSNVNASARWEYHIVDMTPYSSNLEKMKTTFNELGEDGWEYAGSCGSNNYYDASKHIFKRRLPYRR